MSSSQCHLCHYYKFCFRLGSSSSSLTPRAAFFKKHQWLNTWLEVKGDNRNWTCWNIIPSQEMTKIWNCWAVTSHVTQSVYVCLGWAKGIWEVVSFQNVKRKCLTEDGYLSGADFFLSVGFNLWRQTAFFSVWQSWSTWLGRNQEKGFLWDPSRPKLNPEDFSLEHRGPICTSDLCLLFTISLSRFLPKNPGCSNLLKC